MYQLLFSDILEEEILKSGSIYSKGFFKLLLKTSWVIRNWSNSILRNLVIFMFQINFYFYLCEKSFFELWKTLNHRLNGIKKSLIQELTNMCENFWGQMKKLW